MPKIRALITLEYDANDLLDQANWTQQVQKLAQTLKAEGWPVSDFEVRERRDRAARSPGSAGTPPRHRPTAPA